MDYIILFIKFQQVKLPVVIFHISDGRAILNKNITLLNIKIYRDGIVATVVKSRLAFLISTTNSSVDVTEL